jgi:hypothetical protein
MSRPRPARTTLRQRNQAGLSTRLPTKPPAAQAIPKTSVAPRQIQIAAEFVHDEHVVRVEVGHLYLENDTGPALALAGGQCPFLKGAQTGVATTGPRPASVTITSVGSLRQTLVDGLEDVLDTV